MSHRIGLWVFLLSLSVAACHTQRGVSGSPRGAERALPAKQLAQYLAAGRTDFEWLGAKSHAELTMPDGQKLGFALNIRVRRDSLIWLQFMKFGIEGARARVTPFGGLEVLDRQQRTYTVLSYDEIQQLYGVSVSYHELQDLLVGQPAAAAERRYKSSVEDGRHVLSTNDGGEGQQFILEDSTFLLRRYVRESPAGSLDLLLDEYARLGGRLFAQSRTATLIGPEAGGLGLDIRFEEVVFDEPQRLTFEVPDRYQRQ